jgi:hypothetical protein
MSAVSPVLRQLVAPHGWGSRLGVWTHPPAQSPPLAREGPGVEVCASACSSFTIPVPLSHSRAPNFQELEKLDIVQEKIAPKLGFR